MSRCRSRSAIVMHRVLLSLAALFLFVSPVRAKDHILVVTGVGGDANYTDSFIASSDMVRQSYVGVDGLPDTTTSVTLLRGDDVNSASFSARMAELAETVSVTDSFTLMLVGHGSYDGEHYKFNIPGPDVTDADLKTMLSGISAEKQLIVVGTSASGALLKGLSKEGRILVTATKSGSELNAVRFPQFWAQALSTGNADYDRNELITVEEAFRYAQEQTNLYYEDRNLLATEHAQLVGDNASGFTVARIGRLTGTGENPRVSSLLDQRVLLESELSELIDAKSDMSLNDYYDELEQLMLRMARLQRKLDQETGWASESGALDTKGGSAGRG